jgi:FixJ family two-component response regulator
MTPTPTAAKVPPVVFVIDDDASVRAALSSLVRSVGLRVEVFASASEFLATKRTDGPSCLILDVRLPGMSGLHFQAELAASSVIPYLHHRSRRYPNVCQGMKAGAVGSNRHFATGPLDAIKVALERAQSGQARRRCRAKGKFEVFASRKEGYGAR